MDTYGISRAFMFCMDEPDREPAFRAPNDRTLRVRRALERTAGSVRPARPDRRGADRRGRPLPRSRARAGSSSIPRAQRFALNDERLVPGVRARRRAPGADPDPRRARAAADRRPPPPARRALSRRAADHRSRAGSPTWPRWPGTSPAARASSSTPRSGARSTSSTSSTRCRRSRSSTRRTTRTGASRSR